MSPTAMNSSRLGDAAASLRPRRRATVLSCDAGNEVVLFDQRTDTAVSLNLSAAAIWELCNGDRSVADIITALADASGVDFQTLQADVEHAIQRLRMLDLLSGVEQPESVCGSR